MDSESPAVTVEDMDSESPAVTVEDMDSESPAVIVEDVENFVNSLDRSNSLDYEQLCIKHVLYSHPAIFACLKLLFNEILLYGVVSENF